MCYVTGTQNEESMANQLPDKAYKSQAFLNAPAARHIRILCEYEEPRQRLLQNGIRDTLVMFGSARIKEPAEAAVIVATAEAEVQAGVDGAQARLDRALKLQKMSRYYDDARALARKLTEWSMESSGHRYYVCSGGGPGIMEAANRGASDVPGGKSVGFGISLPFEKGINQYVTPELGFEFHYFFTRKYWFLYPCKGLVIFPGGFGTLDELFETLTLVQTGKIKKKMPIVLFGKAYWDKVLNIEAMAEFGTISDADLKLFFTTDDVDDAFRYIAEQLS